MRLLLWIVLPFSVTMAQEKALQPQVREVVDGASEERIAATIQKLASFGTRNTLSTQGVVQARQWIEAELKSYSPRLQVSLEHFKVKKNEDRIFRDVDLYNVIAVLPGKATPETQVFTRASSITAAVPLASSLAAGAPTSACVQS